MMEWQYLTLSVLVTILSMWYIRTFWSKDSKLPPGPPRVPFPFNVLLVKFFPKRALAGIQALARRYGDIVFTQIGDRSMVLISKRELVKELLVKQAEVTSGRQALPLFDHLLHYDEGGLLFSSDEVWMENRRLALMSLRSMGMGKRNLEHVINEEANALSEVLLTKHQGASCIRLTMYKAVANIFCSISFGHRFEYDDTNFNDIVQNVYQVATADIGFLASLPLIFYRTVIPKIQKVTDFIKDEIESHRKTFDANALRDLTDMFIAETERLKVEGAVTHLKPDVFSTTIFDLFAAGTETTTTTMMWCFLMLAAKPEVQARIATEVDMVIGPHRKPAYQDRESMPYTEAFLLEIHRFRPVAPVGIPHRTTRDININGYRLPKGCDIVMNTFGMHHDPSVWDDPEVFQPERFLDEDGKRALKYPELVTFGAGRRVCLGERLAKMEMFLFLTNLIQRLTFKLPDGATPSFNDAGNVQVMSPAQYEVIIALR